MLRLSGVPDIWGPAPLVDNPAKGLGQSSEVTSPHPTPGIQLWPAMGVPSSGGWVAGQVGSQRPGPSEDGKARRQAGVARNTQQIVAPGSAPSTSAKRWR